MSEPMRDSAELRKDLFAWQVAGTVFLVVLVLAFPAYKIVERHRRADALTSEEHALVSSGRQLWSLNCASCHGASGQGVDAPALNSQQFLTGVGDDQMHGVIAGGVPGSEMPAWLNDYGGPLTDQQIGAIVAFVRSWQKTAPSRPDWRQVGSGMGAMGG